MSEKIIIKKILSKDISFFKNDSMPKDLENVMGGIDLPYEINLYVNQSKKLNHYMKKNFFESIVIVGIGGSINSAKAIYSLFSKNMFRFPVKFIDTINPDEIEAIFKNIKLKKTLFVISSKSGTTIETISLENLIRKKYQDLDINPTSHIICITDENSPLHIRSKKSEFGMTITTKNKFGGRFSGLSQFGLISIMLEKKILYKIVTYTQEYIEKIKNYQNKNDSLELAKFIIRNLKKGKNKLTIISPKKYKYFNYWIEQLIAESTGKESNAIIPICNEDLFKLRDYSYDRQFIFIDNSNSPSKKLNQIYKELNSFNSPTFKIDFNNPNSIGKEMFKWQIITILISEHLKINPFDQPDVESSKINTTKIIKRKLLNVEKSIFDLSKRVKKNNLLPTSQTEYIALILFCKNSDKILQIRESLTIKYKKCVSIGFGPKYLHSLGQLYKGGPKNIFVFCKIQFPKNDFILPSFSYSLKELYLSQALGDLLEMEKRGIGLNVEVDNL